MLINKGLYRFKYQSVANISTSRDIVYGKTRYLGCFPGWDNTPRKKNKGVVFDDCNPEAFETYLVQQMKKSPRDSFIFINAWNEWAEGAYLEPDSKHEYSYLKAVKNAKKLIELGR
nr:glycoside hydrolase family 99-like domain-containing protein [Vibrio furnissii]